MIAIAKAYPIRNLVEVGRDNKARCVNPDHLDEHPSMHVRADNTWKCYVCQMWGDSIDMVMIRDSLEFREAVRRLQ